MSDDGESFQFDDNDDAEPITAQKVTGNFQMLDHEFLVLCLLLLIRSILNL